jgi:hypothetical protein
MAERPPTDFASTTDRIEYDDARPGGTVMVQTTSAGERE